jgi:hypothetical protein
MKYCTKCGTRCEDKALFCAKCGTKFEIPETGKVNSEASPQIIQQPQPFQQPPQQFQPPPYQPPQYAPPPVYGGYNPAPPPVTAATGILKQISSSPMFLIFALLYSILLIIDFIKVFAGGNDQVTLISGLIGWIISALLGLGLWLHFGAASDTKNAGVKTSGLTVIKVGAIILLVVVCIAVLILFISVALLLATAFSSSISTAISITLVMFFMVIIGSVLAIVYYAKVIASINAVSACASMGYFRKVSTYVIVFNFIFAFFMVLQIFAAPILTGILYQYGGNMPDLIRQMIVSDTSKINVLNIASFVLNAVVLITISAAMISYNSKIGAAAYQRLPQYPQTPQNQYPGGF